MTVLLWVAAIGAGWVAASVVVALVVGRVIRLGHRAPEPPDPNEPLS